MVLNVALGGDFDCVRRP
ncbi:hypothetical protein ACOVWK_002794 [Escherichia coli]